VKQALSQRRVVLSLFYANLLWWNVTYAQRSSASFGPCTERSLGYTPRSLAVSNPAVGGVAEIAILSADPSALHRVTLSKDGALLDSETVALPKDYLSVSVFEGDRHARGSYVLVSQDARELLLLRPGHHETPFQTITAPLRIQRVLAADINNDKRKDFLLFGKSTAGVVTLLAKPGGSFKEGPLLFPEISVTDMKTMDLNGDGITDVMLLNWLSNELVLFYGITGTIFSEQVTVPLPGEPVDLGVTEVTRDRRIRVAITIPEAERIICLTGNSTGEFEQDAVIVTPRQATGIVLADIDGDGLPDVVSSTTKGLLVALARGARSFAQPAYFANGGADVLWGLGDMDGDHMPDLVTASRDMNRLMVAANSNHASTVSWPDHYIVGSAPHGICLGDFNRDGRLDVAVANTASSTLSILVNNGEGMFSGQISLSVQDRPLYVRGVPARTTEGYTLLVSHSGRDMITVVTFTGDHTRPALYTMPTGDNPYVLLANDDPRSRKLEILVRYRSERDASLSLSLFEQLSGKLFLERNLKAKVPNRITALTVADILGRNDLLVATHDRSSRLSTISLAPSSGTFDFRNPQSLFAFSDSTSSVRSLLCSGPPALEKKDIFVILSDPRNAIGIARGKGKGAFRDSLQWINGVHPLDDAALQYEDVDGDSIGDLTVLDSEKKAIIVYYGERDGRFGPARVICRADDVNGFAIGSLRRNGRCDLVMTHGRTGTVSMTFNPFRQ